jgi:hypothetical protein
MGGALGKAKGSGTHRRSDAVSGRQSGLVRRWSTAATAAGGGWRRLLQH